MDELSKFCLGVSGTGAVEAATTASMEGYDCDLDAEDALSLEGDLTRITESTGLSEESDDIMFEGGCLRFFALLPLDVEGAIRLDGDLVVAVTLSEREDTRVIEVVEGEEMTNSGGEAVQEDCEDEEM